MDPTRTAAQRRKGFTNTTPKHSKQDQRPAVDGGAKQPMRERPDFWFNIQLPCCFFSMFNMLPSVQKRGLRTKEDGGMRPTEAESKITEQRQRQVD